MRARVRALVYESHGLRLEPTQEDIESLHADGYVGEVLQKLRAEQAGPQAERARDALVILARILDEVSGHAATNAIATTAPVTVPLTASITAAPSALAPSAEATEATP
jgi:hypothetical protein